jgi:hypothetical protein
MTELAHLEKQKFIANTPLGAEFGKNMAETGVHCEDGTVVFNSQGQYYYTYKSIEDYADNEFLNKDVVYLLSTYVGDRDDSGNITWFSGSYDDHELDPEEDESCVYTKPELEANVDRELLNQIRSADAFDLLEIILKQPELLSDELTIELFRRRDAELKIEG